MWFVCKCYVEDDCCCKFWFVEMLLNDCFLFLLDIFGCDKVEEKGFIDVESCDDFDGKLLSFEKIWNKR